MKTLIAALLAGLLAPGLVLAQSAPKAPPSGSAYFPIASVRPGLKGYCLLYTSDAADEL